MDHSTTGVNHVGHITKPLPPGRNEYRLGGVADHPPGIRQVQQDCANAVLAHWTNAVSQEQPSRLRLERWPAISNLDYFPGEYRAAQQLGLVPEAHIT